MDTVKKYIEQVKNKVKPFYEKYSEHEKTIIEVFVISIITGIFTNATISQSYKHILDITFMSERSGLTTVFGILFVAFFSAFIYRFKPIVSKMFMLVSVYVYLLMCAYTINVAFWANNGEANVLVRSFYLVILSVVAFLAFYYIKDDFKAIGKKWSLKNVPMYVVVAFMGIFITWFVSYVSVLKYLTYGNATFDFGIFAQMYEYMAQTGTMNTTVEREVVLPHYAVHFSPIFYVGLPFYMLHRSPTTIGVIQAVVTALPLIPIILLCKQYKLSNWTIIGVSAVYTLFPATVGGTMYDIHENCFLPFLLLMLAYMCEKKNYLGIIIFSVLVFCVKEDAGIYLLILGLFYIFSRKDKAIGISLMVIGASAFAIATGIVKSYGRGVSEYRFADYFYNEKKSLSQVIITILTNPGFYFSQVVRSSTPDNISKLTYLIQILFPIAPILFTMKKNYSRYILMVPLLLINIGTTYSYMHQIGMHYNFGPLALVTYILIMNLADMDTEEILVKTTAAALFCGIFFSGFMFEKAVFHKNAYKENKAVYESLDQALDLVPDGASISTTGNFVPHFADHQILYEQGLYYEVHQENPDVDYLVIDMRRQENYDWFAEMIDSGEYTLFYTDPGKVLIYQRNK